MPSRAMARAAAAMIVANGGGLAPTPDDSHTPGPWHAAQGSEGGAFTIYDDRNGSLATIWSESWMGKEYPIEANARLISASPSLLLAAEATNDLLVAMQRLTIEYLKPDGGLADEAYINEIIGLLDGPKQRAAQHALTDAIAKGRGK